jgi:hypothetical protein
MTVKTLAKRSSQNIYQDLRLISAQLGEDVVCMIAAKCLSTRLEAGEWDEVKNQLSPKHMRKLLNELKGGK